MYTKQQRIAKNARIHPEVSFTSIGRAGGLDFVWMEEANRFRFTEKDFEELLTRLRGTAVPWRQIQMTTNPDAPTHWLNSE